MNWPRPFGPVKCDVTATSGISGWLQTKQTASLYQTERDIFAYISAKIKMKMSTLYVSQPTAYVSHQPSMFTRTLQVFSFSIYLVESYEQLSRCLTSEHFLLALTAYSNIFSIV